MRLLPIVVLAALASGSALAAEAGKCNCKKIAGLWVSIDKEAGVGTFINVPATCKGVKIQQIPERKEVEGLITDEILCENGKYRMQYRFPEGYVDDEGNRAVYPLPPEIAIALRGNVCVLDKDTLALGMDLFGAGKCGEAKFTRVPKSEILGE